MAIRIRGGKIRRVGAGFRRIGASDGGPILNPPTGIASSRGLTFDQEIGLADNATLVTLTLTGGAPNGSGTWSIDTGLPSWADVDLSASTGTSVNVLVNKVGGLVEADIGAKTIKVDYTGEQGSGALSITLTPTVVAANEAMTTMLVTNTSGSTASGPIVFGFLPVPGTIDTETQRYTSPDMTIQEDNHSHDRSPTLRVASGCAWVTSVPANSSEVVTLRKEGGAPSAGATKSIADLLALAADWDEDISVTESGTTYSVNLRDVLSTGAATWTKTGPVVRATKWRDGPVCKEYVIHSPLYNGATPHPLLHLHATVAFFSGDNFAAAQPFVRTQFRIGNQWAFAASPRAIVGAGSVTQGVASPTVTHNFAVDDMTGVNVVVAAGPATHFRNLTRASGVWSNYIIGSTLNDAVDGFRSFVTKRLSDTEIEIRYIAGSTTGTLTSAIAYPFSWHWGHNWVQELWWPSVPPLVMHYNYADTHNARLWPNHIIPSALVATGAGSNEAWIAAWGETGSNPFRHARAFSTGGMRAGEELQDGNTETRTIPHLALFENDGGWIAGRGRDRTMLHGFGHMIFSKRALDDDTGLPISIDDHLMLVDEDIEYFDASTSTSVRDYKMIVFGEKKNSHRDHAHYLPGLLTGDYWWRIASAQDFIFMWAAYNAGGVNVQGDIRLMLDRVQSRSRAWNSRLMTQLVTLMPSDAGDLFTMTKARLRSFIDYNYTWIKQRYIDNGTGSTGWSFENPAGPNLSNQGDPMYYTVNESTVELHPWQQMGYEAWVANHVLELGEASVDATSYFIRIWDNNVNSIMHPDIAAKTTPPETARECFYGRSSNYQQSPVAPPFLGWGDLWDFYGGTRETSSTYRARRAFHLRALFEAKSSGIYPRLDDLIEAIEWAVAFSATEFSDLTQAGGEPNWSEAASWNSNFYNEMTRPRS